jgi:hypothetical protein
MPLNAQVSLEPVQLLPLSVSFIDCVESMTITTLYGVGAAPLMDAVAVAVIVNVLTPTTLAKVNGTVACCFTWMALPPAGATHGIPWFVRVVRHFTRGYPDTIVTFGRLE